MSFAGPASLRSFTNREGLELGYAVLGGGDTATTTLVCHPGGPGFPGDYFGDLAGLASRGVRVIRFDPRGTGRSGEPADGRYELESYADDLDDLRAHLGLDRIDLLGHSHGGFVGMTLALRRPQALGRLILCCSTPSFGPELNAEASVLIDSRSKRPWFEDTIEAQRARSERDYESPEELGALYEREGRLWFVDDEVGAAFLEDLGRLRPNPAALHYFNDQLAAGYDLRPRLGEIEVPTLVLNGAEDTYGPRFSARELAAIPNSTVRMIPDVGHFAFVEAPARFRAEIEAFLGEA